MELNSNLFKTEGYVGRRDYIFNFFTIGLISSFFFLPYSIWVLTKIVSLTDLFNSSANHVISAPFLIKVLFLIGIVLSSYLYIVNIAKRTNDIFGKTNIVFVLISSFLCVLSTLSYGVHNPVLTFLAFLFFMVNLFLMTKKGKLSSKLPYDYKKEFNWGAFLGTWAWGLFNKCYIPLWHLLLLFTPWGFYYQIFCGMRGNEWAYKSKKWDSVEKFNKSQENQTVFWTITTAVAVPFLIISICICTILIAASFAVNNSEKLESTMAKIETLMNNYVDQTFTSYEINDKENKFYISESVWKKTGFDSKKGYLDLAASHAASVKSKNKKKNDYSYYSKSSELKITKIYSSSDKDKLLGEYVLDTSSLGDVKSIMKAAMSAYRFYN